MRSCCVMAMQMKRPWVKRQLRLLLVLTGGGFAAPGAQHITPAMRSKLQSRRPDHQVPAAAGPSAAAASRPAAPAGQGAGAAGRGPTGGAHIKGPGRGVGAERSAAFGNAQGQQAAKAKQQGGKTARYAFEICGVCVFVVVSVSNCGCSGCRSCSLLLCHSEADEPAF